MESSLRDKAALPRRAQAARRQPAGEAADRKPRRQAISARQAWSATKKWKRPAGAGDREPAPDPADRAGQGGDREPRGDRDPRVAVVPVAEQHQAPRGRPRGRWRRCGRTRSKGGRLPPSWWPSLARSEVRPWRACLLPAVARNSQENTPFVKRLHLLRHASRAGTIPTCADHERPLAPRGRERPFGSPSTFAARGSRPSSSSARRRFAPGRRSRPSCPCWRATSEIRLEDGLYGAGVDDLLSPAARGGRGRGLGARGRAQPDAPRARPRPHSAGRRPRALPDGALASIAFGDPWAELDEGVEPSSGASWFRENSAISFVLSSSAKTRASPVRARRFPYPFLSW